jgi:hypothetical protein
MQDDYLKQLANQVISLNRSRFSIKAHLNRNAVVFECKAGISNAISRSKIKETVYGYREVDLDDLIEELLMSEIFG